jgi:hypothetical protein
VKPSKEKQLPKRKPHLQKQNNQDGRKQKIRQQIQFRLH